MIYVLLEKRDNLISSIYESMQNNVHVSCRQRITKRTTYETIKSYKQPPLLAAGWLLMVSNDITASQLKLLSQLPDSNLLLFRACSRKELSTIIELLDSKEIKYTFIDNFKIPKETVVDYIMKNLDITKEDATYLAKRQNYYDVAVVNSVRVLSNLGKATRDNIKRYTSINDTVPLFEIFNYIFKLKDCNIDYYKAVKLVYQYRYAFNHLIGYVKESCELYTKVFSFMVDGRLNIKNYKEFRADSIDKKIGGLTEYQLYKIVCQYEEISIEFLYLVTQLINTIPIDSSGIPQFISLLKMVQ